MTVYKTIYMSRQEFSHLLPSEISQYMYFRGGVLTVKSTVTDKEGMYYDCTREIGNTFNLKRESIMCRYSRGTVIIQGQEQGVMRIRAPDPPTISRSAVEKCYC